MISIVPLLMQDVYQLKNTLGILVYVQSFPKEKITQSRG
jgi:hypothetical protein